MTDEELLVQVNNAISAVTIGGQSYSIGSRSLTRANLAELRSLKADLEARISKANGADTLLGNTFAAFFDGR